MNIDEACKWLKTLDSQIRKYHAPEGRKDVGSTDILRPLTLAEWEQVKALVEEHELPLDLWSDAYGFSLCVYAHGQLQGEIPEQLLFIDHTQFPHPVTVDRVGGQVGTLRALEPLVYRPRNHELLEWYGIEPLCRDITLYAY